MNRALLGVGQFRVGLYTITSASILEKPKKYKASWLAKIEADVNLARCGNTCMSIGRWHWSMTANNMDARLVLSILPAVLVGLLFEVFLGHRHDYTGHYAAGYGGTYGALMVCLKGIPVQHFARFGTLSIVPICFGCILLGVFTEATLFRIAKFDEVDFFNQSLGAVLAGYVTIAYTGETKPPEFAFDRGIILAVVFLSVGGCFAVA